MLNAAPHDPSCDLAARSATAGQSTWATLMWLAAVPIVTLAAYLLWRRDRQIIDENQLIENLQFALLLSACAVHALRAGLRRLPLDTLCRAGLALLCLSFAVREVDIDKLGTAAAWPMVEWWLRAALVLMWIVFVGFAVVQLDVLRTNWRAALFSACAAFTVAGGGLYVASVPLDQMVLPLSQANARFCEEAVQLNATLMLFAAATTAIIRPVTRG